jgi:hypothetical protein
MRHRTKLEVIDFVQSNERVGEAIACLVNAIETNSNTKSYEIYLLKIIGEETDFARNETLEEVAS